MTDSREFFEGRIDEVEVGFLLSQNEILERYAPNVFEPTLTAWICPFCNEVIARVMGHPDHDALEEELAEHITSRHPIRRWLSRRSRRAFKQRRANQSA